jgi:type IV secretory pathway TraG/TraD family ATPase VirD4
MCSKDAAAMEIHKGLNLNIMFIFYQQLTSELFVYCSVACYLGSVRALFSDGQLCSSWLHYSEGKVGTVELLLYIIP